MCSIMFDTNGTPMFWKSGRNPLIVLICSFFLSNRTENIYEKLMMNTMQNKILI